jgi:GT2 family glycosyltransferase
VLFLDDDVVPSPDWAGWLVAALHATPETACATGLILPLDTRTDGQRLLEEWGGFGKGLERRLHQHPHPAPPGPLYPYQPGAYGSGANVGFWAERLRALGGYDEVLGAGTPAHGGEDLAMQMSVVLSGRHLSYEPSSVVWHRHRASKQEWTRQLFWYGVGLSATMLRRALSSPRDLSAVLVRLPAAVHHGFARDSARNAGRSPDYPRSLVLVEILGMLVGPFALVLSLAHRRRQPR